MIQITAEGYYNGPAVVVTRGVPHVYHETACTGCGHLCASTMIRAHRKPVEFSYLVEFIYWLCPHCIVTGTDNGLITHE